MARNDGESLGDPVGGLQVALGRRSSGSKPDHGAVVMASERDEPAGAAAKAWRRHGERLRRPGSPAMMPPRRGKGIFGPMDCVARLPDSAAIGRRSLSIIFGALSDRKTGAHFFG